ncbi:DNA-binding LacI/PurR family transcriptional regulator [Kineococcus xinjiangensis]|uniref:DNA-binding LacI/PurR family transcriptional regulator n=1 Tax=Kineococcus xinjiangensis TaxID=512762 RepID=A0A2S6IUU4_9ACTN|nr:LacI family DNA-binding transcriptional regulator [Kineococcus xinjiangensis]PPK98045.1 DNA-binding LacI/PurR family transcriptional regulator [Kineococcus xinjiangensis]
MTTDGNGAGVGGSADAPTPAGPVGARGGRRAAPTLRQVAAAAGVSRATASRVINGGHLVSDQARAAVEAAIAELGFVPHPVARSLATRRTDSVALVVPEPNERLLGDPFFGHIINGLSLSLEAADLQMVLVVVRPGSGQDRAVRYLTTGKVDGAVVTSHHREDSLNRRLVESGLPCAFQGRPLGVDSACYVDTDNVAGARRAAEHLIASGRRRIGTVAGPADMAAGIDRLTGWREALTAAGLPVDAVEHGDFTVAGGTAAVQRLLRRHPDLDAVFLANDLMASGALGVLAASGRRVPEDVAVFGYDDLGLAATTTPPLSTVVNPVERMAARAGAMIADLLAGGEPSSAPVILDAELVLRASA